MYDSLSIQTVLVSQETASEVWEWLCREISDRPTECETNCVFDHKQWGNGLEVAPLEPEEPYVSNLATLYLISQLGDMDTVLELTNSRRARDVVNFGLSIEPDIKKVLKGQSRFRNALSEHLAFWVHLATISNTDTHASFAHSLPNFQPEDKGPDGVSIAMGSDDGRADIIEIHSVKNSINNPRSLIATTKLRSHGTGDKPSKILDEFWYFANEQIGLGRLDRLLDQTISKLSMSADRGLRMALYS